MIQRVTVVPSAEVREKSVPARSHRKRKLNFYEAMDASSLAFFWILVILLSYVIAFAIVLTILAKDARDHFLYHHKIIESNLKRHTTTSAPKTELTTNNETIDTKTTTNDTEKPKNRAHVNPMSYIADDGTLWRCEMLEESKVATSDDSDIQYSNNYVNDDQYLYDANKDTMRSKLSFRYADRIAKVLGENQSEDNENPEETTTPIVKKSRSKENINPSKFPDKDYPMQEYKPVDLITENLDKTSRNNGKSNMLEDVTTVTNKLSDNESAPNIPVRDQKGSKENENIPEPKDYPSNSAQDGNRAVDNSENSEKKKDNPAIFIGSDIFPAEKEDENGYPREEKYRENDNGKNRKLAGKPKRPAISMGSVFED